MTVRLLCGDCRAVMRTLPAASVDAIVTDPPYELGFMGKGWDRSGIAFDAAVWTEALRVLKPGGHLLAFGGTRMFHRLAVAIEDAGFELRDTIGRVHEGSTVEIPVEDCPWLLAWVYGSGFPKSLDVSKAIDKAAGAEPRVLETRPARVGFDVEREGGGGWAAGELRITEPATDAARAWQGWGTALKPAWEPIVMARKPLVGTVAANVQQHGTGALNIDACRVPVEGGASSPSVERRQGATGHLRGCTDAEANSVGQFADRTTPERYSEQRPGEQLGRWPANLIHDGSEGVLAAFPDAPGQIAPVTGREPSPKTGDIFGEFAGRAPAVPRSDSGRPLRQVRNDRAADGSIGIHGGGSEAAGTTTLGRWPANVIHDGSTEVVAAFPNAPGQAASVHGTEAAANGFGTWGGMKAGRPDAADPRGDAGGSASRFFYCAKAKASERHEGLEHPGQQFAMGRMPHDAERVNRKRRGNHHPTVKPVELMRYLVKLVTPPGGVVLDPFCGSGSTLKAAELEQFDAIGIDLDPTYVEIGRQRVAADAPLFAAGAVDAPASPAGPRPGEDPLAYVLRTSRVWLEQHADKVTAIARAVLEPPESGGEPQP